MMQAVQIPASANLSGNFHNRMIRQKLMESQKRQLSSYLTQYMEKNIRQSSENIPPQFLDVRLKTILIPAQTKMVSQLSRADRSIPSTQSKGKKREHMQYFYSNMEYIRNIKEREFENQQKEDKIKSNIFSFSAAFNALPLKQLLAAFGTRTALSNFSSNLEHSYVTFPRPVESQGDQWKKDKPLIQKQQSEPKINRDLIDTKREKIKSNNKETKEWNQKKSQSQSNTLIGQKLVKKPEKDVKFSLVTKSPTKSEKNSKTNNYRSSPTQQPSESLEDKPLVSENGTPIEKSQEEKVEFESEQKIQTPEQEVKEEVVKEEQYQENQNQTVQVDFSIKNEQTNKEQQPTLCGQGRIK
ncbi:MAG: hypothetical protein EZS28_013455 [Streblomastix strix]|uniref:Uncharacterized protein n=1 Tax=Streblomastix strix TaxID=222440 RepID=A0A5J4W811_9EUKA|nr:MAG: hypothetical protein EZS28_013455 [Streblomastix strix]